MLRHETKSIVLKKRFHHHSNEFVGANGLDGLFPECDDNFVNVYSQIEFQTYHKCPRESFWYRNKQENYQCHFSLSLSFFFLGINYIYKLEHAFGINELTVVKDEIGGICFSIGAASQSVFS